MMTTTETRVVGSGRSCIPPQMAQGSNGGNQKVVSSQSTPLKFVQRIYSASLVMKVEILRLVTAIIMFMLSIGAAILMYTLV